MADSVPHRAPGSDLSLDLGNNQATPSKKRVAGKANRPSGFANRCSSAIAAAIR
jgi:hypothetical protein